MLTASDDDTALLLDSPPNPTMVSELLCADFTPAFVTRLCEIADQVAQRFYRRLRMTIDEVRSFAKSELLSRTHAGEEGWLSQYATRVQAGYSKAPKYFLFDKLSAVLKAWVEKGRRRASQRPLVDHHFRELRRQRMSPEQVIAVQQALNKLNDSDRDLVKCLFEGSRTEDIAEQRGVTTRTVQNHLHRIASLLMAALCIALFILSDINLADKLMFGRLYSTESHTSAGDGALRSIAVSLAQRHGINPEDRMADEAEVIALHDAFRALSSIPHLASDASDGAPPRLREDTGPATRMLQDVLEQQRSRAVPPKVLARTHRNLGALAFLEDNLKAIKEYQRATTLDPENPEGWVQLGVALRRAQRPQDAELAYYRALVLPDISPALRAISLTQLGELYLDSGQLASATSLLERSLLASEALGQEIHEASNLESLGKAYLQHRRLDDAENSFERALELNQKLGREGNIALNLEQLAQVRQLKRL